MAGAVITSTLTLFSVTGESYTGGKNHKWFWWNSWQSRWDGVLPYNESHTTPLTANGDYWICKDITGTPDFANLIELEVRASGAITTFWDDAGKKLYCVSFHDTTSKYWEILYNSATDTYTFTGGVGTAGSGETVTGMARDAGGKIHPGSIYVVPNGDVWVALQTTAGGLMLNRRKAGAWNASVVTMLTGADEAILVGAPVLSHFVDTGTTYLCVFASEDDLVATPIWTFKFIDQDHATPMTETNWSTGTIVAQTEFSTDSDNHIDVVRDAATEALYYVLKTGSAATGETLIGVLKHTGTDTWTSHSVVLKTSSTTTDRTRPVIALDSTNSKLYVAYSQEDPIGGGDVGDLDAWWVSADLSDLDTWSAETLVFSSAGKDFNNVRSPQSNFNCTNSTGMLFTAPMDALYTSGDDDEVWFNLVTIPAIVVSTGQVYVIHGAVSMGYRNSSQNRLVSYGK